MRHFKLLLATISLVASTAFAAPATPKSGAEYIALSKPQATQAADKKIEVIEFFMYHCPACNAVESTVKDWVKKNEGNITFKRMHLPLTGANDPEAHLFLTLEAMKLEDNLHDKVMATWHVERRRLTSDADNLDWAVKNGVDKAKFLEYYTSFAVITKLRNMAKVVASYQVDSTPTFIVDGRYLTNPSMIEESNKGIPRQSLGAATMQTLDALIAKAKQEKGIK